MNLQVFLSDRCNMACDYCFLDLNKGPATVLGVEDGERALAELLPGSDVTFLGGEPFVHFENLRRLAAEARRLAPGARLNVFTNGVLACPEKMAVLRELGVDITLSLDGAGANDRHRKLVGRPFESAWGEALKAVESLDPAGFRVNMVVCEDGLAALLPGVEDLRRRGFKRLSFHLNIREDWSDRGLEALKKTMQGFLRYFRALPSGALELTHLENFSGRELSHGDEEVILGADGNYYPCDGFFSLPYAQAARWSAGSARAGLDRPRLEALQREARDFIHARLDGLPHYSCPREPYFHALASGGDADAAVRSFLRADAVFGDALRSLAEVRAA